MFILWGALATFWAVDKRVAIERIPTALSVWILYLIVTSLKFKKSEISAVSIGCILGGVTAAVLAYIAYSQGIGYHNTTRASLTLGTHETDPNFFAASLLLPLSLAFSAVVRGRSRALRLLSGLAVLMISFCILLTMSRGGLIGMIVIFLLQLRHMGLNRRVMIALVAVSLALFFLPGEFFSRLHVTDRGAGRIDIWIAGLTALPRYCVQGAGWNNFAVIYHSVAGNAPVFHGLARGAHNILLSMAVEVGVFGLVFMLLAVRSQLAVARGRYLLPYAAAAWGMLAAGMFLDVVWRKGFWMTWMLLAIVARYRHEHPSVAR